MLSRNRVADFEKWKAIFDSHVKDHQKTGLILKDMWRDINEPNNVFFIFEVQDMDKAKEFINSPESAKAGEVSGVIDGEYNFIENIEGYS